MSLTYIFSSKLVTSVADAIEKQVFALSSQKVYPQLVSIVASNNKGVGAYEKVKSRAAEKFGINYRSIYFSSDTTQEELKIEIKRLANDGDVHGIMLALPFYSHIDAENLMLAIPSEKDVDGLGHQHLGMVTSNYVENAVVAATPAACVELAQENINMMGKLAVVVGIGRTVGRILVPLLQNKGATVISCNSKTQNLGTLTRQADVVFSATGRANLLGSEHLRSGQVVIDAGVSYENGHLEGDTNLSDIEHLDIAVTPPKGGVGPLTTHNIFKNLLKCIELQRGISKDLGAWDETTILQFNRNVARLATPGGGAVSMQTSSMGIALALKALQKSQNKKQNSEHQLTIQQLVIKGYKLLNSAEASIEKDIRSFGSLLDSYKRPVEDAQSAEERSKAIQTALANATVVPLEAGNVCVEAMGYVHDIHPYIHKSLLSDWESALYHLEAATRSVLLNVDINVETLEDRNVAQAYLVERKRLEEKGEQLCQIYLRR